MFAETMSYGSCIHEASISDSDQVLGETNCDLSAVFLILALVFIEETDHNLARGGANCDSLFRRTTSEYFRLVLTDIEIEFFSHYCVFPSSEPQTTRWRRVGVDQFFQRSAFIYLFFFRRTIFLHDVLIVVFFVDEAPPCFSGHGCCRIENSINDLCKAGGTAGALSGDPFFPH